MKQFYVVPINDDEFSLSWSPSTLNLGSMYFVTYIPIQRTLRVSGAGVSGPKEGDEVGEQREQRHSKRGEGGGGHWGVPDTAIP